MNELNVEHAVRHIAERPEVITIALLYRPRFREDERWLVQVVNHSLPILESEGSTAFAAVLGLMH